MNPPPEPSGGCPLCRGTQRRRLVTKRGWEVVRCLGCGLVYVWPQPSREELEALYSAGDYHAALDEAERRRYFARRLRQVEALAPGRGRILDAGCSKGYFLELAQANGWQAVGVDLNRRAVEDARARGLDVRHGDLAELVASGEWRVASKEQLFDVVTLFDVLEHTADPRATLAACREVLKPGGLLAVATPDIGGLVPRVTYGLFARTLGAWEHPTPPGHLVQFSRRTLRQAIAAEGFELVRERSEHIPVAYSAGKLENSIMDVLAGRAGKSQIPDSKCQIPDCEAQIGGREAQGGKHRSPLASVPRYGVRAVSWLAIGLVGLAARAVGWGDSMFVAVRRAVRA